MYGKGGLLKPEERLKKKARILQQVLRNYSIKAISIDEMMSWMQTSHVCEYCSQEIAPKDYSLDHRLPLARGGKNDYSNLHLVCKSCNSMKGQLTEEEFVLLRTFLKDKPEMEADITRRLKAGGGFIFGR